MRLSAVNSINFKANNNYESCNCPDCRPDLYPMERFNDYDLDPQTLREQYIKERDDISPLTGIFMVGAGLAALKAGNKGVAYLRRGFAYAGEAVAQKVAKVTSKAKKNINYDEQAAKIQNFFSHIKDDCRVNDEKLTKRFTDAINAILSPKDEHGNYIVNKGEKIVKTLNNFGIFIKPTSLFDHGVAMTLAIPTMSEAGKRLESDMDKKQFHEGTMKQNNIYEKVAFQVLKEALSEGI